MPSLSSVTLEDHFAVIDSKIKPNWNKNGWLERWNVYDKYVVCRIVNGITLHHFIKEYGNSLKMLEAGNLGLLVPIYQTIESVLETKSEFPELFHCTITKLSAVSKESSQQHHVKI